MRPKGKKPKVPRPKRKRVIVKKQMSGKPVDYPEKRKVAVKPDKYTPQYPPGRGPFETQPTEAFFFTNNDDFNIRRVPISIPKQGLFPLLPQFSLNDARR